MTLYACLIFYPVPATACRPIGRIHCSVQSCLMSVIGLRQQFLNHRHAFLRLIWAGFAGRPPPVLPHPLPSTGPRRRVTGRVALNCATAEGPLSPVSDYRSPGRGEAAGPGAISPPKCAGKKTRSRASRTNEDRSVFCCFVHVRRPIAVNRPTNTHVIYCIV